MKPPVFPAPEPDIDFEALLGEIKKVSPNWTTPPPTLMICTGPTIEGIDNNPFLEYRKTVFEQFVKVPNRVDLAAGCV